MELNFLYLINFILKLSMKRLFSTLLTFLLLSIAVTAIASGEGLERGEYRVLAYTLSDGSSNASSGNSPGKSVSFHSLYISSEAMNTVLNREDLYLNSPHVNINKKNNYQGFALKTAYAPTSNITFHSSIGLTDNLQAQDRDYTERIGWEVDLGIAYKFLNNFAYEVHFGYMDTGELFKESSSYTDVDNITIVVNKLTMSF